MAEIWVRVHASAEVGPQQLVSLEDCSFGAFSALYPSARPEQDWPEDVYVHENSEGSTIISLGKVGEDEQVFALRPWVGSSIVCTEGERIVDFALVAKPLDFKVREELSVAQVVSKWEEVREPPVAVGDLDFAVTCSSEILDAARQDTDGDGELDRECFGVVLDEFQGYSAPGG